MPCSFTLPLFTSVGHEANVSAFTRDTLPEFPDVYYSPDLEVQEIGIKEAVL